MLIFSFVLLNTGLSKQLVKKVYSFLTRLLMPLIRIWKLSKEVAPDKSFWQFEKFLPVTVSMSVPILLNLFILFIYLLCCWVLMYLLSIIVRVITELKRDSITGGLIVIFEQVFPKWLNDICKHENKKELSTVVFRKISLYSENLFCCILIYYL